MTFRVSVIDPRDGSESVILNGITHRPFGWQTQQEAEAYVAECKRLRSWQHLSDKFELQFKITSASEAQA